MELEDCYGCFSSNLSDVPLLSTVTEDQFIQIKACHKTIVSEVMRMRPTPDDEKQCMLITFLTKISTEISLDFPLMENVVKHFQNIEAGVCDSMSEQHLSLLSRYTLVHATHISPNIAYSIADPPSQTLNASDAFPNPDAASTYKEYFEKKYDLCIGENERMLELCNIGFRLGALTPKPHVVTSKRSESQRIHLPLSLCGVYPIPSSVWRELGLLPSLIYIIHRSLLIKELWQSISTWFREHCPHLVGVNNDGSPSTVLLNEDDDTETIIIEISKLSLGSSQDQCLQSEERSKPNRSAYKLFFNVLDVALTSGGAYYTDFKCNMLAFIGDTFLKYTGCVELYLKNEDINVPELKNFLRNMVSNDSLHKRGLNKCIPKYIRCSGFAPKADTDQILDTSENNKLILPGKTLFLIPYFL